MQGYVAVGDCLVSGTWAAPRSAAVLRLPSEATGGVVAPPVVCPLPSPLVSPPTPTASVASPYSFSFSSATLSLTTAHIVPGLQICP